MSAVAPNITGSVIDEFLEFLSRPRIGDGTGLTEFYEAESPAASLWNPGAGDAGLRFHYVRGFASRIRGFGFHHDHSLLFPRRVRHGGPDGEDGGDYGHDENEEREAVLHGPPLRESIIP